MPPGAARTLTAAELESGAAPGLEGSLGDGFGKWRLDVESAVPILAMSLLSSPTGHLTNLSAVPARESAGVHRVPLFPPASDPHGRQGFARVVNRSDAAGEVRIEAFDDTRWSYGALTLSVGARQTRHFNSADLELGNAAKGLSGSTGAGEGDWRLELTSELDIEVLSYVRTVGGHGYVTPMHDTAAQEARGPRRYYVPVFHPARHEAQRSRLHLANLGAEQARVGIDGVDDAGGLPPAGTASLVLGAGETRVLTAAGIEAGAAGVAGRFGTGSGRWRLFVSSEVPLQVMSLGYARDGFLANLSRGGPPGPVPAPPARPDLVVEAPSVGDGEAGAGAVFTLSATVRNRGGGDAGATTLRYHRSADDLISASDTQVGAEALAGLAPAAGVGGSVTLTTPSAAGTHYYGACVDAVPDEADTANNCSSPVGVTVLGVKPPKVPDLVVDSASASDVSPAPGGPLTLSATVRNRGGGDAAATTLRYHRSADATITPADAEVGTAPVGALAASGSAGSSTGSRAPSSPGAYYYGACADAVADESDTPTTARGRCG